MIYKLLFCIIGIIVLLILLIKYYRNKTENKIRKKIYISLIVLACISIIMHIGEVIFFTLKNELLFEISWWMHWMSTYGLFLVIFYYFLIYLNLINPNNIKQLLFEGEMKNIKIAYIFFIIAVLIGVAIFIQPININGNFEFIPNSYSIYIISSMFFYGVFLIIGVSKFLKKNDEFKKKKIINIVITLILISFGAITQIILKDISILSLGILLGILYTYLAIENIEQVK